MTEPVAETWSKYEALVTYVQKQQSDDIRRLEDKINALTIQVAMLNVKAGAWGVVGGAVSAGLAMLALAMKGS